MPVSRFQLDSRLVQLDRRLKLFLCRSDIDDITPNFGCDLEAGPLELLQLTLKFGLEQLLLH